MSQRERKSSSEWEKGEWERSSPSAAPCDVSRQIAELLQGTAGTGERTHTDQRAEDGRVSSPSSAQKQHMGFVFLFAATQVPAVQAI